MGIEGQTGTIDGRLPRIGIDVGGTFTDFTLFDPSTRRLTFFKEASTPHDPSASVRSGLVGLLERAALVPRDVGLIVHGTTIGLNTIIQRRGEKVALIVSRGNRDVLEIARSRMPSSFDFMAEKEVPIVPRDLVFEVSARLGSDGAVLSGIDPAELDSVARRVAAAGVTAVAVMLLHSYRYPALERALAGEFVRRLPGVSVTSSVEIWPERREYERTIVAVLNAYIQPLMSRYFTSLVDRLRSIGVRAPVYVTASNGGTLSVDTASRRAIDTVLSGPASGVVAALRTARHGGGLITFDMGGTSSDIAVSRGREPEYTTHTTVGDLPLIVPVVNVSSIGAGGGSKVWLDPFDVLKVGPESAGSDPGPICYGRGGTVPTITDCYLVMGVLAPERFLGGRIQLDAEPARRRLAEIGVRLGITGPDAAPRVAEAALRVATAKMATELFKTFAQRGDDPRECALVAFGGAGPTQANLLAAEARLETILIPPSPGTFCALGAILADVKRDYIRSLHLRVGSRDGPVAELDRACRDLEREASEWIATEGGNLGRPTFGLSSDMRYAGQSFDLAVALPDEFRGRWDAGELVDAFHRAHERLYGFRDPGNGIEVANLRLRITASPPPVEFASLDAGGTATPESHRDVFHDGCYVRFAVHARRSLGAGSRVRGPAVIEQEDTTTMILPGWAGTTQPDGNLVIRRSLP